MAMKSHNGCDCPIRIVASCANGRLVEEWWLTCVQQSGQIVEDQHLGHTGILV